MNAAQPIRVLLVEDSPTDVLLAQDALEGGRTKFEVVNAPSLAQAVELLHARTFDVVLLDLGLPDGQGLDTLRRIRSDDPTLPVVVMTGTDDEELSVRAVQEGAQDYLVKGQVQTDILVRTIRHAIERGRSRADLRRSEERFRLMVEEVQDYAIFLLDPDGRVATWNEGARRIKGYTAEEIISRPYAIFFPKEEGEQGKPALLLQTAIREGRVRDEGWRLRKDGSTFWAECVITAIHDGKLLGFTKIIRDGTERRLAEESLRQSDAVFRTVAENISAILWVLDATASKCLYVNTAFETIFHRPCEGLYADPSSYMESVLPEDRVTARAFLESLTLDGEAEAEYRLRRADGSIRWLWVRGRAIRNRAGMIERLAGIAEDVTDQKETGQVATLLSAIVECCEDAIVSKTMDGMVIQWNNGAARLYGYTADEMLGKSALILYPPGQAGEYASIMERIGQGRPIHTYQTKRQRKDGKLIDVLVSVAPLISAKAQVEGASVITHDLTETLLLQEQFRQAQKMDAVGRLAGGVAHDFNNLLTIISGYSDIVLDKLPTGDPTRALVSEIRKAGERAAGLTRQLLAFSRKTVLQPIVLDLNAVILDALNMLRRLVGEDVEVGTVLGPSLGRVKVDPGQFEQTIVNLAVNARDAMPQGGKITFETANVELDADYCLANPGVTPGRYVRVAASDNGTGMSEETKRRIFEPFFTTKESGKGTGLGLAMVYGFIKQSGGHIAVYSELDHTVR